jgi:hypothetical protein
MEDLGEFKDNKQNGQGTCTSSDGNTYGGEWQDVQYMAEQGGAQAQYH